MALDYASSWTQICNRALGRLGAVAITDMTDGTESASYCTTYLPDAVEEILGQYNWNCCRKRVLLSPDVTPPDFGYKNKFPLPIDLIRLIKVYPGNIGNGGAGYLKETEYHVECGNILSQEDELRIIYIARPADPNMMSPGVRKAVSAALAFLLTTPLTSNEQLAARIAAEMNGAIELAKTQDAQMNYDPQAEGQPWYREEAL